MLFAYCHRSGQVYVNSTVPPGAIALIRGPAKVLRRAVSVEARRRFFGGPFPPKPGIPALARSYSFPAFPKLPTTMRRWTRRQRGRSDWRRGRGSPISARSRLSLTLIPEPSMPEKRADQLKDGDVILLKISQMQKSPTGYIKFYTSTGPYAGSGRLQVVPLDEVFTVKEE